MHESTWNLNLYEAIGLFIAVVVIVGLALTGAWRFLCWMYDRHWL